MPLVSEEMLPKSKRKDATKDELHECLEFLEKEVLELIDDGLYKAYKSNAKKLDELSESIEGLHIDISSDKDDKTFDRWLKYVEKQKSILEAQVYIKEHSSISQVWLKEQKKSGVSRGVKN